MNGAHIINMSSLSYALQININGFKNKNQF